MKILELTQLEKLSTQRLWALHKVVKDSIGFFKSDYAYLNFNNDARELKPFLKSIKQVLVARKEMRLPIG